MDVFIWIEETSASLWFREALWAFPTLLVFHALGMAVLVGTSVAINLRLLGFSPAIYLQGFKHFYPIMHLAFTANLISGLLLVLSYPAKALTNPLFFVKMTLVTTAVVLTLRQRKLFYQANATVNVTGQKKVAALILVLWIAAIFSGRFLAYTHKWLLVS